MLAIVNATSQLIHSSATATFLLGVVAFKRNAYVEKYIKGKPSISKTRNITKFINKGSSGIFGYGRPNLEVKGNTLTPLG